MPDPVFNQTGPLNLTVLYEDYGPELPVNIEEISLMEDTAEAEAENMTVAEPMRAKRGLNYLEHATSAPDK